MTTLQSYDTPQLLHILNSRSGGMELVGTEFKNIDELVDATHKELDRRFAERGEFVRLSNKQKTMCGPAYICGKIIDGIMITTYYERDADKAKSYRRSK
nr:MAG TPA: hypothetical protein [Caudoviricetes sp.]